jgi:hypothetical protein
MSWTATSIFVVLGKGAAAEKVQLEVEKLQFGGSGVRTRPLRPAKSTGVRQRLLRKTITDFSELN